MSLPNGPPETFDHASPRRPPRIVGIGGSASSGSMALLALNAALEMAQELGATTISWSVRDLDLPIYEPDRPLERYPISLRLLLDDVRAADGLILCSPTYHGTITGAMKNVLDTFEFLRGDNPSCLNGKVVGLMAAGGEGAWNTINALGHTVRALRGLASPSVLVISHGSIDRLTGEVTDLGTHSRMMTMAEHVVSLAGALQGGRAVRDAQPDAYAHLAQALPWIDGG